MIKKLLLVSLFCFSFPLIAQEKPNVIVIMADDLGYSDLGCFGSEINTPNLDAIAMKGQRMSNFFNAARCCPTRASLLTGQYQHRVGIERNGRSMNFNGATMAELLSSNGYQTAMVGKWHLTQAIPLEEKEEHLNWINHQAYFDKPFGEAKTYPINRGFEKFYGLIWGVVDCFDPFSLMEDDQIIKSVPKDYYTTTAFTEKSILYVNEMCQNENPFFLYLAYNAPHWPIHALPQDIEKYKSTYTEGWEVLRQNRYDKALKLGIISKETHPFIKHEVDSWNELTLAQKQYEARKMAVHAAMVDRLDQGVGKLVETLKAKGEYENTIIIFLADNGASPEIPRSPGYDRPSETKDGITLGYDNEKKGNTIEIEDLGSQKSYTGIGKNWANAINSPYRYWKAESYNGGNKTPAIVSWPASNMEQGLINSTTLHVIDILPTVLASVKVSYPNSYEGHNINPMDGVDFSGMFSNSKVSRNRPLFFEHETGRAMISENWKIVSLRKSQEWALYNLSIDATETRDNSSLEADKLEVMKRKYSDWTKEVGVAFK